MSIHSRLPRPTKLAVREPGRDGGKSVVGGCLRPNEKEVAAKVMDGEAILINLSSGVYYSTDKVGGMIWAMIEEGGSVEDMVAVVRARYDVSDEQARADVERLAAELLAENLVVVSDGESPYRDNQSREVGRRESYEPPQLNIYRDMGDLLALDPPMPGLSDMSWKKPEE